MGNRKEKYKGILKNRNPNDLKRYAVLYHSIGFNVTCITNYLTEYNKKERNILKTPYHKWEHFYNERQKKEELLSYDWENAIGIGLVLGSDNGFRKLVFKYPNLNHKTYKYISALADGMPDDLIRRMLGINSLRAFDIDGCNTYSVVENLLKVLGLPWDYEWIIKSGSNNGYHIIVKDFELGGIYCENGAPLKYLAGEEVVVFLPNHNYHGLFERIELRWKAHLVLPPSRHISGNYYEFSNGNFPISEPLQVRKNLRDFLLNFVELNDEQKRRVISKEK